MLEVGNHMLKCGSPLLVVKQAIVYNFSETLITLAGHLEGLLVISNHASNLRNRPAFEGDVERQHLPEDDSKRIHIGSRSIFFTSQNFWCHPMRCTNFAMIVGIKLLLVS